MIAYRCSSCSSFDTASRPIASNRCRRCGGWLARIDQTPDPISYVDGLGSRGRIKQMDRVVPIPPLGQIHQKPDVGTETRKEDRIKGNTT